MCGSLYVCLLRRVFCVFDQVVIPINVVNPMPYPTSIFGDDFHNRFMIFMVSHGLPSNCHYINYIPMTSLKHQNVDIITIML